MSIPLSAADRMKRRTRSSETGFEAHLVKPVGIDDLLKLLEAR